MTYSDTVNSYRNLWMALAVVLADFYTYLHKVDTDRNTPVEERDTTTSLTTHEFPPAFPKRGRVVIHGFGHDADGHQHITNGDGFRLVGGSKQTHAKMFARLKEIQAELQRRGLSFENVTREEANKIAAIVGAMSS